MLSRQPFPPVVTRALQIYMALLVGIFVIEWGAVAYHAFVLHAGYPTNTVFLEPVARFTDWTLVAPRVSHYGEPGMLTRADLGLHFPYPLPSLYFYLLFIRLFPHPTLAFLLFALSTFVTVTLTFWVYLYRRTRASNLALSAVWITLLLGFPAQFMLDRANIEVSLWLLIAAGLTSFVQRRNYLAAFFFAVAACMKLYPAIFFLLFIPRRQYKAASLGACLTAIFTLAAFAATGPSIPAAFHDMSGGAEYFHVLIMTAHYGILRFDHSVFGLEKQILFRWLLHTNPALWNSPVLTPKSLRVYSILAPLVFAAIYLFRLRRLPLLNQFCTLTLCALTLPYVSNDYTLIHLYLVFAVLLTYFIKEADSIDFGFWKLRLPFAMACFAIIFAPLAMLAGHLYMGQIRCLLLLALLGWFLKYPMPSSLFHDRQYLQSEPHLQSEPPHPALKVNESVGIADRGSAPNAVLRNSASAQS